MRISRFLAPSAAAALAWALINGLGYYWFGHALAGADTWLQVVLVCAGLAWILVSLSVLRRRALRRLHSASPAGDLK
jgi:membrane protein DedA with SNARE-associated domain